MRALDIYTVKLARGTLPGAARWILNTVVAFLKKGTEEEENDEDLRWLATLAADPDADIELEQIPEWLL